MDTASAQRPFAARLARLAAAAWPHVLRWKKELAVLAAIFLTIVAPFLLRPAQSTAPSRYDRRLVILTPHPERIRQEFGRAFARHWKEKTGETLFLDWRVPGGTSEIAMYLKSEFTAAFQHHWESSSEEPWSREIAGGMFNAKLPPVAEGAQPSPAQAARKAFVSSDTGIGVDLFFGGGAHDFIQQAENGALVASAGGKPAGVAALMRKHPDWFSDQVIPEKLSGEPFRDKEGRWAGACLSSFGIVFNRDVLRRLGVERDPEQWDDLADPRLAGQVALADPTKSGSVTKAFEMIIQQQMQKEIAKLRAKDGKMRTDEQRVAEGVKRGWEAGFRLIQRITANARYFTDASSKIPLEVFKGDAAAGMTIDYYGRTAEEDARRPDGSSRIGFATPVGGTSIGVDPIGLLRGAPEPELAAAFIEFVLGDEGQKLWSYRASLPGGPVRSALRRLPVRRDFYTEANQRMMSDAGELPYEKAKSFVYEPAWTRDYFNAIRFLIRVTCIDTHREQKEAWQALIRSNFPPRATEVFHETQLISYETTKNSFIDILRSRDKVQETKLATKLGALYRGQYERALRFALAGR